MIEKGKRLGSENFLKNVEEFFKLEPNTLLHLRNVNTLNSEDKIQEEQPMKIIIDQEIENKITSVSYPSFVENFVQTLLTYEEDYAKQKISSWIVELQEEDSKRIITFDLEEMKENILSIKKHWIEQTDKKETLMKETQTIEGYIKKETEKHFFSIKLDSYSLSVNVLQNDNYLVSYLEKWLGICSISYTSYGTLISNKLDQQVTHYLWFNPHISIREMYNYIHEFVSDVKYLTINENRLYWYLNDSLTLERES